MATLQATSIFESFNARWLEPRQVAQTFVPPSYYRSLIKRRHTLTVGPRGSGKTTLLKMLQGAALEAWRHDDAAEYRSQIDFTGVFIPTDRTWSAQLTSVGHGEFSPEHQKLLSGAAFTTHVLRAIIDAIQYRTNPPQDPLLIPHRRVVLSREAEALLANELMRAWSLKAPVPSLLGLRYALSARLSEILEVTSSEAIRGPQGREERLSDLRSLHLHFLVAAAVAIEIFNSLAKEQGSKWALLFDELELAPKWIREELLLCLRSTDPTFLFKLSLSPFTADRVPKTPSGAMDAHDYETIALWYPYKEQGYAFSRALVQAMLRDKGLPAVSPENLLGPPAFDEEVELGPANEQYAPGSSVQRTFEKLARKDKTFKQYLQERGIDLRLMKFMKDDQRAADVRKVVSLVAVREAFRKGDRDPHEGRTRSRKNPRLYRGASALFAIAEGNPRWLIGMLNPLLEQYCTEHRTLPASRQAAEVSKAANRFRSFLKTIPCPAVRNGRPARGILSVLDSVGEYFFASVVLDDFNADPPGSFTVDANTSQGLMDSLATALNAGAIIYVPDQQTDLVLDSLRGKRFRISYLLAPHYRLPIRLGRALSLNRILRAEEPYDEQPELFALSNKDD